MYFLIRFFTYISLRMSFNMLLHTFLYMLLYTLLYTFLYTLLYMLFAYVFIYAFCICFYICFLSWIMNIGLSKLKPERLLSPSPGQRPGILQMINIAPCKGKILVYESFALTGRKTQRAFYTRGVTPGLEIKGFQP